MRRLMNSHLLIPMVMISAIIVVLSCPDTAVAQCAMCRETLKDSDNAGLIRGFLYSILFMGSVPTLMLAGVGMLVLRSHRLAKAGAVSRRLADASDNAVDSRDIDGPPHDEDQP